MTDNRTPADMAAEALAAGLNPCTAADVTRYATALRQLLDALAGEIVTAALVRESETDLLHPERQEVNRVREFLDGRITMRSEPSDLRCRALAVLDAFLNEPESATQLPHDASPSLDAHSGAADTASVGVGSAPGSVSPADPGSATEAGA